MIASHEWEGLNGTHPQGHFIGKTATVPEVEMITPPTIKEEEERKAIEVETMVGNRISEKNDAAMRKQDDIDRQIAELGLGAGTGH